MTAPEVTITVTESSVVFGGRTNVYRYDRPSPPEIAAYVRGVLGPEPGGAVVHVVGEQDVVEKLDRAFTGYDITLTAGHPADSGPPGDAGGGARQAAGDTPWDTVQITRPEPGGAGRSHWVEEHGGWVLGAAVVIVSAVSAGAIWASVGRSGAEAADSVGSGQGRPALGAPAGVAAEGEDASGTSTSVHPDPPTMVVERQGLRVEVPAGFSLVPDGEMWRATGDDPNFRLQIAVDNLYHLPAARMLEQVLLDIEADPEVELVSNDGAAVLYHQRAPDGSETLWKTWADGGHQLFVGCHTRYAPTTVQQATCRMAMGTAAFDPKHGGTAG